QTQHAIVFAINPDAPAITRDSLLFERAAFAPAQRLPRVLSLYLILVDDRSPAAQRVGVHRLEFSLALRFENRGERADIFAGRNRAAEFHVVVLIIGDRQAVDRQQFVILAGALPIADCNAQTIVWRPNAALTKSVRARDLLLH